MKNSKKNLNFLIIEKYYEKKIIEISNENGVTNCLIYFLNKINFSII